MDNNRNRFNLSNSDIDYIARNAVFVEKEMQEYRDIFASTSNSSSKNQISGYSGGFFKSLFMIIGYIIYRLALVGLFAFICLFGYRFLAGIFLK